MNKEDRKGRSNIANIEEEKQLLKLDFGDKPEKLKGEYLDMYEGIPIRGTETLLDLMKILI